MTKLDAALLKLEGALDYTIDSRVRTLIDVAQQAIEAAKHRMEETKEGDGITCLGGYQRSA